MEENLPEGIFTCSNCDHISASTFKFCPSCGTKREWKTIEANPFKSKDMISLLSYFFLSIIILLGYKASENYLFGFFEDLVLFSALFAVIDVVFAIVNGRESFLFSTTSLKLKPVLFIIIGLISFAFLINFVADFLNSSLFEGYAFDGFVELYSLVTVIGFHCLYPAVFEELAFRGFLINNIRNMSNDSTAILVSGFLFGITHLSFISLIWLIPLGVFFGYLRIRYNTLWYGIIGHFVYNLTITLIERDVL